MTLERSYSVKAKPIFATTGLEVSMLDGSAVCIETSEGKVVIGEMNACNVAVAILKEMHDQSGLGERTYAKLEQIIKDE